MLYMFPAYKPIFRSAGLYNSFVGIVVIWYLGVS
jgi:hypothetical protein